MEKLKEHLEGENAEAFKQELTQFVLGSDFAKDNITKMQEAYLQDNVESKYSEITAKAYKNVEEALTPFGEKKEGEKASEYAARLIKESKGSNDELDALKAKYDALKDSSSNAGDIDNLQKKFAEEKRELEDKIKGWETKHTNTEKATWLKSGLKGLEFNVAESVSEALVSAKMNEIMATLSRDEDGAFVIRDNEGKVIRNEKYEPITAPEFWANALKDIVKTGEDKARKAADTTITKNKEGADVLVVNMATVRTRQEFITEASRALSAKGVKKTDKEWNVLLDKACQAYNYSSLPRN